MLNWKGRKEKTKGNKEEYSEWKTNNTGRTIERRKPYPHSSKWWKEISEFIAFLWLKNNSYMYKRKDSKKLDL